MPQNLVMNDRTVMIARDSLYPHCVVAASLLVSTTLFRNSSAWSAVFPLTLSLSFWGTLCRNEELGVDIFGPVKRKGES